MATITWDEYNKLKTLPLKGERVIVSVPFEWTEKRERGLVAPTKSWQADDEPAYHDRVSTSVWRNYYLFIPDAPRVSGKVGRNGTEWERIAKTCVEQVTRTSEPEGFKVEDLRTTGNVSRSAMVAAVKQQTTSFIKPFISEGVKEAHTFKEGFLTFRVYF